MTFKDLIVRLTEDGKTSAVLEYDYKCLKKAVTRKNYSEITRHLDTLDGALWAMNILDYITPEERYVVSAELTTLAYGEDRDA